MSAQKEQHHPVVPATVSFHENTLLTAEVNGTQYAAMKPIIEGMGLDRKSQQHKITSTPRYGHITLPLQTPGGIQKMLCIPIAKLNGWLFSVNAERVKPEIREKIIRYQEECFVVLHDYWHKGAAIHEEARPRIETEQPDPARLAESLMQALIASLTGRQGEKIDDLGVEIVARLQDLQDSLANAPQREDLMPALEVLGGNVTNLRRHLITMLPKLAIPEDTLQALQAVARRLNDIANIQDDRDFAFHERIRTLEMRFKGVELNIEKRQAIGHSSVQNYVEANVPETLRQTFDQMFVSKAAGAPMLLRFMNEVLLPDPDAKIEVQRLYPVYCAWCFTSMHSPVPITSYRKLLRGFLPKFKGMNYKTEQYVQYITGARVRMPKDLNAATDISAAEAHAAGQEVGR
jgi:hypothetical protein